MRLRNLAGYCEQLAGSCSVSASASSAYSMAYRQPRVAGAAANLSLEALQVRMHPSLPASCCLAHSLTGHPRFLLSFGCLQHATLPCCG